ncbi:hypothetical protein CJF42_23120 [Pseudoalteromonas sp. NBT06-2]|nr:hypothetical protein CJF42_23120 [Pseudoalteromonas sp. NBT06-2]
MIDAVHRYGSCLEKSVSAHPDCKKRLKLERVGIMNATNLYLALGCAEAGVFNKGRDVSACIGLTPIQYSSGGIIKLGSIGKYTKNSLLRSLLICGVMATIRHIVKREAKNQKEVCLKALVDRRGKNVQLSL